jgi:Glycosyltransferases involved in cell wall biogenesis
VDIDILLSTYNGEQYLRNQIESIINQTYKNWRLLIRDDGSQDKTIEILEYYLRKHKDKIVLIEDGQKHLGLLKVFLGF